MLRGFLKLKVLSRWQFFDAHNWPMSSSLRFWYMSAYKISHTEVSCNQRSFCSNYPTTLSYTRWKKCAELIWWSFHDTGGCQYWKHSPLVFYQNKTHVVCLSFSYHDSKISKTVWRKDTRNSSYQTYMMPKDKITTSLCSKYPYAFPNFSRWQVFTCIHLSSWSDL